MHTTNQESIMLSYHGADLNFSLEGKTAIITGGAAGIGYAAAKFFAQKGVNLVLADLNPEADAIAKELGPGHIGVSGNVGDAVYRQSVIDAAVMAFGKADILVNSAGIAALEKAEIISEDFWNRTIAINLTASFMMAQAFGSYLIENKLPGSIVNIASQAGSIALDKHVAYCASKGGVIAMTKVLALEWGKYGIRVNCVSPTVVLTELGHKAWDGPAGDAFKKEVPAGRFAEPDEIAGIIAFLCSNTAAMITGHDLLVDGGFTIK
jgi:NAD(P)-dependent dehydrogenase (short-subunit alcohol dehydrogenase family)